MNCSAEMAHVGSIWIGSVAGAWMACQRGLAATASERGTKQVTAVRGALAVL